MGKILGQHFLSSSRTANRIVQCAAIKTDDVVLEIGPGTGALTEELLKTGATVIAVEKDMVLAAEIRKKFGKNRNFVLIEADIRDVLKRTPKGSPFLIPKDYPLGSTLKGNPLELWSIKVVANIPYYLSGQLFRLLVSDIKTPPRLLVLMVQKEVADRVVASKKMNLLALSIQSFMEAHIAFRVGRGQFHPPPEVDSAILVLERRPRPLLILGSPTSKNYFALIKAAFGQKRKMALGVLQKGAFKGSPYQRVALRNQKRTTLGDYPWGSLWEKCKIDKKARAEDISLEQWLCIAKHSVYKS